MKTILFLLLSLDGNIVDPRWFLNLGVIIKLKGGTSAVAGNRKGEIWREMTAKKLFGKPSASWK